MTLLAVLLLVNVVLHAAIVVRFGAAANLPPLVFGVLYLVLAVLVFLAVPYSLWATLVVSVIGTIGLVLAFGSIPRDKTIERVIIVLNVVVIAYVAYLLFAAAPVSAA